MRWPSISVCAEREAGRMWGQKRSELVAERERARGRDEAPIMLREAHIMNDSCIHL